MIAELEKLRFFRSLSLQQLDILSDRASVMEYEPGEIILDEHTTEKFVGYAVKGVGVLSITTRDGVVHAIETFANAPVGVVYLDGFNQPGVLAAKTRVKVIGWSLEDVEDLGEKHPSLALAFHKGLNFYLVQYIRRIVGTLL